MASQKRSNNMLIVIGLVLLIVGAGFVVVLLRTDGDGGVAAPTSGSDTVPVVVSKRPIARGSLGRDLGDAVEVRQVPAVTRPSDAIVSLGELTDRTAVVDIGSDQPLRAAFFRQRTVRGDTITIPEGKQAVAVTIPFTPAVAGYVGQGDVVNVYALVTKQGDALVPPCEGLCTGPAGNTPQAASRLVLSNVLVLDVSQEVAPTAPPAAATPATVTDPRAATAQPTITYLLALDANEAERAILLTTHGQLYLTLVPRDQPPSSTQGRDQLNVLRP